MASSVFLVVHECHNFSPGLLSENRVIRGQEK